MMRSLQFEPLSELEKNSLIQECALDLREDTINELLEYQFYVDVIQVAKKNNQECKTICQHIDIMTRLHRFGVKGFCAEVEKQTDNEKYGYTDSDTETLKSLKEDVENELEAILSISDQLRERCNALNIIDLEEED